MSKGKDKAREEALKMLREQFGKEFVSNALPDGDYKAIPTGYDDLDDVLTKGAKGIYLGGVVEILGPEHSGKSSLAMRIVGQAQKQGYNCMWFDAEATFSPDLALINGIDLEDLQMPDLTSFKPTKDHSSGIVDAATVLNMIFRTLTTGAFKLIVVDSVAGLMPERILLDKFDGSQHGISELARVMADLLPPIVQACKAKESTVVFVNQLRDQPGKMYQDQFHTPGGRALKFYASQRISVSKIGGDKGRVVTRDGEGNEEQIGHYARAYVPKNKRAMPLNKDHLIQIPIYYKEYFPDDAKLCYDIARRLQVITIRQGTLTWKDFEGNVVLKIHGESDLLNEIRDKKMEPLLAYHCTLAEKEQTKKDPIKVGSSVKKLAEKYNNANNEEI